MLVEIKKKNDMEKYLNNKVYNLDYYMALTLNMCNKNIKTKVGIKITEEKNKITYHIKYKGVEFNPWVDTKNQTIGGGLNKTLLCEIENKTILETNHKYINGENIIIFTQDIDLCGKKSFKKKTMKENKEINKFSISLYLESHEFIEEFKIHEIQSKIYSLCKSETVENIKYIGNTKIIQEIIFNIASYSKNKVGLIYNIEENMITCISNTKLDIHKLQESTFMENIIVEDGSIKLIRQEYVENE